MEDKKRNFKFNMTIGCLTLILIATITAQVYILKHSIKNIPEEIQNEIEEESIVENTVQENIEETLEPNTTEENIIQENNTVEKESVEEVPVVEEKSLSDKLIDKIKFKDYLEASIYKVGNFTRETIPNDLILRMGFARAVQKPENKQVETSTPYHDISKDQIENGIKELFGSNIKYKHDKFINIDVETFNGFYEIRDTVKPVDNNEYEFIYYEGGGGDTPFVHQEIYDVIENENKIEIKVKVAYVDTVYDETQKIGLFKYHIYKDFDFKTDEFKNELLVIEDYKYDYVENYGTTKSMADIWNKLNSYSYIFEKDNETGEFYLSEFHKNEM